MPDATTAACLLRSLFRNGRLGCLVKYSLAKEVAELTQSANPISILSTKLNKLSMEARDLLKQLLRLFAKVSTLYTISSVPDSHVRFNVAYVAMQRNTLAAFRIFTLLYYYSLKGQNNHF